MLKKNLEDVEAKIEEACKKSGRKREEVTLIAVSKTKPLEDLEQIYNAGMREFGENKVQEMCDKIEKMPADINWHMIGHLQRNKVKYIVGKVKLIHSVDSIRLLEEINRIASKKDEKVSVLIEINMAKEETKFGIFPEEAISFMKEASHFENIEIVGLMTSAPNVENPEQNRLVFRKMKQLAVDIDAQNIDNIHMSVLSMGMSNDYEIAIEEGSTMVRVGTSIFGHRNYNI